MNVEVSGGKSTGLIAKKTPISFSTPLPVCCVTLNVSFLLLLFLTPLKWGLGCDLRGSFQDASSVPLGKGWEGKQSAKWCCTPPGLNQLPPQTAGLRRSATWKNSPSPSMGLLNPSQDSEVPTTNSPKPSNNKGKGDRAGEAGKMRLAGCTSLSPAEKARPPAPCPATPNLGLSHLSPQVALLTIKSATLLRKPKFEKLSLPKHRRSAVLPGASDPSRAQLCNRPVLPANNFEPANAVYCILQLLWIRLFGFSLLWLLGFFLPP